MGDKCDIAGFFFIVSTEIPFLLRGSAIQGSEHAKGYSVTER